jgi:hypothetical protein
MGRCLGGLVKANGEYLVIAMLLVAFGATVSSSDGAWAEENCLAAPNARLPPGGHWFYRTDRSTQRKCWYVRQRGGVTPAGATAAEPSVLDSNATSDNRGRQQVETVPTNLPGLRGRVKQKSVPDAETKLPKVGTDAIAWPAASSLFPANKTIWPDPTTSNRTDTLSAPDALSSMIQKSNAGVSERQSTQTEQLPTVGIPEQPALRSEQVHAASTGSIDNKDGTDRQGTPVTEFQSEMPIWLLVALLLGLPIVGLFVRRTLKRMLSPRPKIHIDRRQQASNSKPRHRDLILDQIGGSLGNGSRHTLRQLLLILEQEAVHR